MLSCGTALYDEAKFRDNNQHERRRSHRRKPDHDRAAIEAKSQTIGELIAIAGSNARKFDLISIDANRPAEEVLSQLKARIWEVL